jgi:hypothetical protein
MVKRTLTAILEMALAALMIVGGGFAITGAKKAWPPFVCWANDESGSLSRTCAALKISHSTEYDSVEIVEVTGIANMSQNVKKVEFKWRPKPGLDGPRPGATEASMTFRKYDDGWRPAQ